MSTDLEILRAQIAVLREVHDLANSALRSALSVAEREGVQTNWPAFKATIRASLDASHAAMDAIRSIPIYQPKAKWPK